MSTLQTTSNDCCSKKENLKPIQTLQLDNGVYQVGVTHYCDKCGWVAIRAIQAPALDQTKMDNPNVDAIQSVFETFTQKVDKMCFVGCPIDASVGKIFKRKILAFKGQKYKNKLI